MIQKTNLGQFLLADRVELCSPPRAAPVQLIVNYLVPLAFTAIQKLKSMKYLMTTITIDVCLSRCQRMSTEPSAVQIHLYEYGRKFHLFVP